MLKEGLRHNSSYKKLAVQCLNGALCFVSGAVVAVSLALRNLQLLKPEKRYASCLGKLLALKQPTRN